MEKTEVLRKYFGHSEFRPGQGELIDHILAGQDCLGVMPTGAGKSMCYQIPALMLEGVTIVISPLISLMKDQVEGLFQSGVSAAYINSTLTPADYVQVKEGVLSGRVKILYVAPERLGSSSFLGICGSIKIPLVAVDEAHCVSHWGQDFRPSYLKIAEFVQSIPERPILAAFTATATDIVKQDIVRILGLRQPFSITTGFDRRNLYFEVRPTSQRDKDAVVLGLLRQLTGRSAIVYCSTRKNVDQLCDFLRLNGVNARRYHAGLDDEDRRSAQEDFIFDRCSVIVATNAFGMGIDKSDVALVVHYNMPKDLESYYQEAGRAGRDGGPARCILLYSKGDVRTAQFLIEHGHEDSGLSPSEQAEIMKRDQERLRQMTFYSTTKRCLRHFILSYFGEQSEPVCGHCGNCDAELETLDITVEAQKILSCIFRLRQRECSGGRELVAGILCGQLTDEIRSRGFDTLSTFGIMKDHSSASVLELIDFLRAQGYISGEEALSLTPEADELVRSRRTLLMKRRRDKASDVRIAAAAPTAAEDPELMQVLRAVRKKQAEALGVPAYVVFSDATLRDMSVKKPKTMHEFLNISGVGSIKAERYGRIFMAAIAGAGK